MIANDFEQFFEELHSDESHRVKPFPWQNALMKRVAEQGWPTTIDLPTSAGKTATIDIALFHLALEADKPPHKRKAPMRIFFVVDRRLVVDDAYSRALFIQSKLEEAQDGIIADVAQRLSKLSSSGPLQVIRLRGGLPRESSFLQSPLQPAIILSTVDQVGSRLLFRGYGVSSIMRPMHAALVGVDSIIILDEAHLSRPFEETLKWVKRYQSEAWAEKPIAKPVTMVEMTATPLKGNESVFSLADEDWTHDVLGVRLNCSKMAKLLMIKGDKKDPDTTNQLLVETLVREAKSLMAELLSTDVAPVIGVVVNRVATARHIFEQLRYEPGADAILLTGRIRPVEREELVSQYLPRIKAGRKADVNAAPIYVVATQTVEVGADIDFDALVTEAAALDALRQRFGRLNRLGRRNLAQAAIVYVDYGKNAEPDPVYGTALAETWKWLNQTANKPRGQDHKQIDFGIRAMKDVLPTDVAKMLTPTKMAPVLMPAHMDLLVQTNPEPAIEPEIALFLHGKDSQPEDVQIVWRADIAEEMELDEAIETLAVLPPIQLETLAIPVNAARAFLALSREYVPISDIEGGIEEEAVIAEKGKRYAVLWRGIDDSSIIEAEDVRPGNTIVVPSSYGGLDRFGWNPASVQWVRDIGDEAANQKRGKIVIRIHESRILQWFDEVDSVPDANKILQSVLTRFDEGEELSNLCDEFIDGLVSLPGLKKGIREKLEQLRFNRFETLYPRGILLQQASAREISPPAQEVLLESHCRGVADLTGTFASRCGLTLNPEDIMLAGKLHDLGKADPRFQTTLWGGDRVAMKQKQADKILAKSIQKMDLISIRHARRLAGYPKGTRHECYSVAVADQGLDGSNDKDLVKYLIGVHHGRGRPFMPAIDDPGTTIRFVLDSSFEFSGRHRLEQLDSGWPELFWQFNRRYGYWGLAYLETLVRLADHYLSAQEEPEDE
jgi:CRISPR-associated endonuclease/helicase Cas3